MPKLNEYLGGLVSSITNARVLSDLQTVKIAEEYSKHPLLKHFAVPRMRIGDVELNIPVALDTIEEKVDTEYEPVDKEKFSATALRALTNGLSVKELPKRVSTQLLNLIAQSTERLEQEIRFSRDLIPLAEFSRKISSEAVATLGQEEKFAASIKKVNISVLSEKLAKVLNSEFKVSRQTKSIGDLNVIAESHLLNSISAKDGIIRITLKISEHGMEWDHSAAKDGTVTSKLIPE